MMDDLKENPETMEKVLAKQTALPANADEGMILNDVFAAVAKETGIELSSVERYCVFLFHLHSLATISSEVSVLMKAFQSLRL